MAPCKTRTVIKTKKDEEVEIQPIKHGRTRLKKKQPKRACQIYKSGH
jgi:hypothetical protein